MIRKTKELTTFDRTEDKLDNKYNFGVYYSRRRTVTPFPNWFIISALCNWTNCS
jgi:hypothetical protein